MKFKTALIVAISIYVLNEIMGRTGVYGIFPNIDIPMHVMGGFAIAMLGFAFFQKGIGKQKLPKWFVYLFIVGFVMLIGVFWEFHEWILDRTIHASRHLSFSQSSIDDTMKDLLDDFIGASVAFFTFYKKK